MSRASTSSVTIASGTYKKATAATNTYAGETLTSITAAASSKHRYDLIYLDTSDGTVKRSAGTEDTPTSGSDFLENLIPLPPDLPSETTILLAVIRVTDAGLVDSPSGDFGSYAVASVADMRFRVSLGAHLISDLSISSEAQGDLIFRGSSTWGRLAPGTAGKYLRSDGLNKDVVWEYLLLSSLYDDAQTRGDLITRGVSAWGRLAAGSANYYLMSQGAGSDLTFSKLLVGSLYHASEARACIITRGETTWGVLGPGAEGKVLTAHGTSSDLTWETPDDSGTFMFWNDVPGTPQRSSDTVFTLTDTGNANKYDLMFKKGVLLKWLESSTFQTAMVISSSYADNVVTVTIVGDSLTAGFSELKYCVNMVQSEIFILPGYLSTGTDVGKTFFAPTGIYVLSADFRVKTAGITNATTIDINDDGSTLFTTKPSITPPDTSDLNNVATNPSTEVAENSAITIDIDAVSSTPPQDGYIQLFYYPSSWRYRT